MTYLPHAVASFLFSEAPEVCQKILHKKICRPTGDGRINTLEMSWLA